ncbi:MAG TPA: GTPase HflX, partial [Acholeplasma sp.]|nr:GTPase HflX [Acholeplasma sp.]
GETKLEMDRRRLLKDISNIKNELKALSKEHDISRKKRLESSIPVVALVGYTNVGKSSLMNSLSLMLNNETPTVFEKDMLFATLDTKVKRMQKNNYPPFLLIDTVGFIRKLPRELLRSFESTLKDVIDADLLVIVADGKDFEDYQINETLNILNDIKANDIPKLYVLTKKEIAATNPILSDDYLFISNVTKEGIDELISAIYGEIYLDSKIVTLKIDFNDSFLFNYLKNNSTIINTEYIETGYIIKTVLSKSEIERFSKYIIN